MNVLFISTSVKSIISQTKLMYKKSV